MKSHISRLKPKIIHDRNFKRFDEQNLFLMSKAQIFLLKQKILMKIIQL